MKKEVINVPEGIKYLSEWEDFSLPDYPCIIDKQITGCGFTEWAITSGLNVITCSPRKLLLDNKAEQHSEDKNVAYIRSCVDLTIETDRDISKPNTRKAVMRRDEIYEQKKKADLDDISRFKNEVKEHWRSCQTNFSEKRLGSVPCKILVTYDSFRKVKEALIEEGVFDQFYVVVDEFQSIFTDSRFKSTTEMEFVNHLQDNNKVCYVSATPMIEEYLDRIDSFKDLPFIKLDWGANDPSRITHPYLESFSCVRLVRKVCEIIEKYKTCQFKDKDLYKHISEDGELLVEHPKKAVFYFNSVQNICDIIKKSNLTIDDVNVLCSDTADNEKKIRTAFKGKARDKIKYIGKVPLPGEEWKMFTLCTRTVYLGADFYCDSAMSYIFSDANLDCLSVDITIDLPQILGRMRNESNPWKNRAEIYFTPIGEDKKMFDDRVIEKKEFTNNLLSIWEKGNPKEKSTLAGKYRRSAKYEIYKDDYLAVDEHSGNSLLPVFNDLVLISEQRAFDIQQIDYADRCTVFSLLDKKYRNNGLTEFLSDLLDEFNSISAFCDKIKFLCDSKLSEGDMEIILGRIPMIYGNYYNILGPEKIRALGYVRVELEKESNNILVIKDLSDAIYKKYNVGDKIDKATLKSELGYIYKSLSYNSTAKASDIENWFEVKPVLIRLAKGSKRLSGFELIKKKF